MRDAYSLQMMDQGDVLLILAELANAGWAQLEQSDLRVEPGEDGFARFVLPHQGIENKALSDASLSRLLAAIQTVQGRPYTRKTQASKRSLDTAPLPIEAALTLTALSAPQRAEEPSDDLPLLVVLWGDEEAVATDLVDIGRAGRDLSVLVGETLGRELKVIGARLRDGAEDLGIASSWLSARRANTGENGAAAALAHRAGGHDLWLDLCCAPPPPAMMAALGTLLAAAGAAGALPESTTGFAALRAGERMLICHLCEKAVGEDDAALDLSDLADESAPAQILDVAVATLAPPEAAGEALKARIAEKGRTLGYRLSIVPLRRDIAPDLDLEPLLRQRDDIDLQIAQIRASGAAQTRLMRFEDDQLDAMVDGLRNLPPRALSDGSLRYAAGHSAGRDKPVHFLLYDPADAHLQIAEQIWRARTSPHPIAYWLEPILAEVHQRRPSATFVFVPAGHLMAPSLAHFGGNVDSALRLVLGSLFLDVQSALEGVTQPGWVFTPPAKGESFVEVDILDLAAFRPVQLQLGWINDYLQVRSPGVLSEQALTALAEDLYDGAYTAAQRARLQEDTAQVQDAWTASADAVREDAAALLDAHAADIAASEARIIEAQAYLAELGKTMTDLERLIAQGETVIRQRGAVLSAFESKDSALSEAALRFEMRIKSEETVLAQKLEQLDRKISNFRVTTRPRR